MEITFLIKVGELCLKGKNRRFFESKLVKNLHRKMMHTNIRIWGGYGRFFLSCPEESREKARHALSTTFGIIGFGETVQTEKDIGAITEAALSLVRDVHARKSGVGTFKIQSRRTDKGFPFNSYQIACHVGAEIIRKYPGLRADMTEPDFIISIELRESVFLYTQIHNGLGGLPVGTAGRGLLLLSGGIDSPVAGFLIAKRGLAFDSVYFHTYPYASEEAKLKVIDLNRTMSTFIMKNTLIIVDFTEIQLHIKKFALDEEITLLTRAAMMQTASMIAAKRKALCLVTGESLSQVASQTVQSLRFTGSASDLPVMRPLIAFDKDEIIAIAKRLGTYDISIRPYDDCCTLFAPAHPLLRPDYELLHESFRKLELREMIIKAAESAELIW